MTPPKIIKNLPPVGIRVAAGGAFRAPNLEDTASLKQNHGVVAAQYDPAASDARRRCAGHRTDSRTRLPAARGTRRGGMVASAFCPGPLPMLAAWLPRNPDPPGCAVPPWTASRSVRAACAARVERRSGTAAASDEGKYAPRQYRYMSNIVRIARSIYSLLARTISCHSSRSGSKRSAPVRMRALPDGGAVARRVDARRCRPPSCTALHVGAGNLART